jgi:DNA-binding CsgD family transcriptional regulator
MKRRKTQQSDMDKFPTGTSEGLVLVDGNFKVIALNKGAEAILYEIDGASGNAEVRDGLPPDLLKLLTAQRDLDGSVTYVNAQGREYSCRTYVVQPKSDAIPQPVMVLYIEQEMSVVNAVSQVGAEYRLTDREQEALIGVAMGLSSKEVAARMHISPNTVKAFLRLIMVKMGATTRAGIVGRLIDQSARSSAHGAGRQ